MPPALPDILARRRDAHRRQGAPDRRRREALLAGLYRAVQGARDQISTLDAIRHARTRAQCRQPRHHQAFGASPG